MSSRFNLNDNVDDVFGFTVAGLDYDFRYPTLAESEKIGELSNKREVESKKDTPESVREVAKLDDQLSDALYSFITPVGHDTPIKETLEGQNVRVMRAFTKMIQEQLAGE